MSATNKTPFLELPVFVATDKPSWLGDFDCAMQKIDTGVSTNATGVTEAKEAAATADAKAVAAQTTADNATTLANQGIQAAATAQAEAELAHTTADSAITRLNGVDEKIVTLTNKTTTHDSSITALSDNVTINAQKIAVNESDIATLKAAGYAKVVHAVADVGPSSSDVKLLHTRSFSDGINWYTDVLFEVQKNQAINAMLMVANLPASYAYDVFAETYVAVIDLLNGSPTVRYGRVNVVAVPNTGGFYLSAAETIVPGIYKFSSVNPVVAKNG